MPSDQLDGVVDQLVHGYDRGHHRLAGSTAVPDEVAVAIDRLSDAASGIVANFAPYLTGYPLPDGRYALARTWPARHAQRPNTVWTHTLLVDWSSMSTDSLGGLLGLFSNPELSVNFDQYQRSLPIPSEPITKPIDTRALATALSGLYISRESTVRVGCTDPDERDRISLSVLSQQWLTLRQQFAFCTAANARRSLGRKSFHLLFDDTSDASPSSGLVPDPVVQALIDDIHAVTDLRSFLAFVGSGIGTFGSVAVFVRAWLAASHSPLDRERLEQLATLIVTESPDCRQLRRLKRRLFAIAEKPGRSISSDPFDILELFSSMLATVVAAEDASLNDWISLGWELDAGRVLQMAMASGTTANVALYRDEDLHPVGAALPEAVFSNLPTLLTPATTEIVARHVAPQLGTILAKRNDWKLWTAWAALQEQLILSTIEHASTTLWTTDDIRAAVTSLLVQSPPRAQAVLRLVQRGGALPLEALIEGLSEHPEALRSQPWRRILQPEQETIAQLLSTESQPDRIRVLAAIVSPDVLPTHVDKQAWLKVLGQSGPNEVAAIGYLIGRRSSGFDERGVCAASYARLYRLFASPGSDEIWEMLSSRISGSRHDWDRCLRLAKDWTKPLKAMGANDRNQLLNTVRTTDGPAADAAVNLLDEGDNRSLPDRMFDIFRR